METGRENSWSSSTRTITTLEVCNEEDQQGEGGGRRQGRVEGGDRGGWREETGEGGGKRRGRVEGGDRGGWREETDLTVDMWMKRLL